MSEECGASTPAGPLAYLAAWWALPVLCRIRHAWGPWTAHRTSGFNIAWQLVAIDDPEYLEAAAE